jgi:hypothetical protein
MAKQGSAVIKKIQKACVLVTLQVHRWHGTDTADEVSISVGAQDVSKRTSKPKWRLIPKEWNDVFQNIESRARSQLAWYSIRSPIRGSRFIPIDKADELFQKLSNFRAELNEKADKFCVKDEYEKMMANLRTDLGADAWIAIRHVPSISAIRAKFGMDWFVVPIGEPADALKDRSAQSVYVQQAQDTLNKVVLQSVEAMVKEPRQKLHDAVSKLSLQLGKDNRRIRADSIEAVKTAFNEYRNWAFISDEDTLKALTEVEASLNEVEPKQINSSNEVAGILSSALTVLQTQVADEAAMLDGFKKFRRAVEL